MLQTNWNVKEKKIHFRFNLIDPIGGIKRMFSIYSVFNTLKALAKLCLIVPIGYFGLRTFAKDMVMLSHQDVTAILSFVGDAIHTLFWRIMYVLIAIAILDYVWGKLQ